MRKAFWAALDRTAMNKARGGELVADVMTHFIYPEIPGFEEAGGLAGPKVDYNEHPEGDMAIAEKYMRLAGYPSGKYTGTTHAAGRRLDRRPGAEDAEIANQTLRNLGFKTKLSLVDQSVMYAKYCGVPAEEIDVCPNVGWVADFADGQAVLDVPFNGKSIDPAGNQQLGAGRTTRRSTRRWKSRGTARSASSARAKAWASDRQGTRRRRRGDPLRLGQGAEDRVQGRRGRGRPVERRALGLPLHLAEVSAEQGAAR